MSSSDRHIIQKLSLELKTGLTRVSMHELQAKASEIIRHQLPGELESLFAEYNYGKHHIIDRLEITLGELDADRFEEQLLEKLKQRIQKALQSVKAENKADIILLSESGFHQMKLLYYLETGILPWYASEKDGSGPGEKKSAKDGSGPGDSPMTSRKPDSLSDQFKRLIKEDPKRMKDFLLAHRHDNDVIDRTMTVIDPEPKDLFKLINSALRQQTSTFYSLVRRHSDKSSIRDIRIAFLKTLLQPGSGKSFRHFVLAFFMQLERSVPSASGKLLSTLHEKAVSESGRKTTRIHPLKRADLEEIRDLVKNYRFSREMENHKRETDSDDEIKELTDILKSGYKQHLSGEKEKLELLNQFQKLLGEHPRLVKKYLLSGLQDRKGMDRILEVFEPALGNLADSFMPGLQNKVKSMYVLVKDHAGLSSLRDIRFAFLQALLLSGSGKSFQKFVLTFFLRLDRNAPDASGRLLSALKKIGATNSGDKPGQLHPLDRDGLEEILVLVENTRSDDERDAVSDKRTASDDETAFDKKTDSKGEEASAGSDKAALKKNDPWELEGTNIGNAGLVLLSPFLTRFFANLELVSSGTFLDANAQQKAMQLLAYLESGEEQLPEYRMVLIKILCGFPVKTPPHDPVALSLTEKRESEILIESAITHWKVLKNTSVEGFRESFIRRDGLLRQEGHTWNLYVDRMTYDILLDKIPWTYSWVKLPWMERPLMTEW